LGTPALTTRGLTEKDMPQIAEWMLQAIINRENPAKLAEIHAKVTEFARKFPLPSDAK
jgi:glycine hydroxymethyltransferase